MMNVHLAQADLGGADAGRFTGTSPIARGPCNAAALTEIRPCSTPQWATADPVLPYVSVTSGVASVRLIRAAEQA